MKDIMEMSYEANQATKGNEAEYAELFTEMLFRELAQVKSADIAPHLTCSFDVLKKEYNIGLRIPMSFCKTDSIISNVK